MNILVTGSSGGFGELITRTLAEDGHHVFATMRGVAGKYVAAAGQLVEWARTQGLTVEVLELDVTNQASVDTAIAKILASAGHLDVVVNNAGIASKGPIESFTVAELHHVLDVNTFGSLRVNKAVLPGMRGQKSGLIIQVTSSLGRVVLPMGNAYGASKFAMEALAESLHYQLKPFNVDVAIVEPGFFPTSVMEKALVGTESRILSAYNAVSITMPKMPENSANPQDVADAVKRLVDMPTGQRPLRTVVGEVFTAGVEALNKAAEESTKELWGSLGLSI